MIVLLDIETQKMMLYKRDGLVEISFPNATQLLNHIDDENVFYVTNAIEVNGNEIVSIIQQMGVNLQDEIPSDGGAKYLHGASNGTIFIHEDLKFEGKFDCKLLDGKLTQEIKQTPLLQKLIQNKKIEIIGEVRRRRLMEEFRSMEMERAEKQKMIDDQLDKMILKSKVEEYEGIESDDYPEAVEINILDRGAVADSGGVSTMSELLNKVDGLE